MDEGDILQIHDPKFGEIRIVTEKITKWKLAVTCLLINDYPKFHSLIQECQKLKSLSHEGILKILSFNQ